MSAKRKKIINWSILVIIVILVIVFGYKKYQSSLIESVEYTTAKVEQGNLRQTVSATGTIKPLTEVELNFKNTGKITTINVQKGDKVKENDILAKQDSKSFEIAVSQAQANLTSAIATLNKMKAGASDEDIAVDQKNVDSAQTAYDNSVKNLETVRKKTSEDIITYEEAVNSAKTALADKKINLDDVKEQYNQDISNIEDSSITTLKSHIFTATSALDTALSSLTNSDAFTLQQSLSYVSQSDGKVLSVAQNNHNEAVVLVDKMASEIGNLESNGVATIDSVLNSSISTLNKVKETVSNAYGSLQETTATTLYPQADIDANKILLITRKTSVETGISELQTSQQNLIDAKISYNTQVNSAQASVNTAEDNYTKAVANLRAAEASRDLQVSNSESDIDAKLAALNLAKSKLDFKKAPPRSVDLASQEAQVEQYRAALALAQDNLDNTTLKSSLTGVVTKINFEVGEQSSLTIPTIVLVTEGNYEIEVDISESDIVKVKNNDSVDVTFDALGDEEIFKAKVIFIDPGETVISDVVYYNVKIALDSNGNENFDKIKPGMTSNIEIMTDYKENVLMIPQRAVQQKNGGKYVRILEKSGAEQNVKELEVETGISGDDGLIEILGGLDNGQEVVTFVKSDKK